MKKKMDKKATRYSILKPKKPDNHSEKVKSVGKKTMTETEEKTREL